MIRSVRFIIFWQKPLSVGLGNYIADDNQQFTETVDNHGKHYGSEHSSYSRKLQLVLFCLREWAQYVPVPQRHRKFKT